MSFTTFQPPLTKKRSIFFGSTNDLRRSSEPPSFLIKKHGSIPIYGVAQSIIQTSEQKSEEGQSKESENVNKDTKEDEYEVSRYLDSKTFRDVPSTASFMELAIFSLTGLQNFSIPDIEQSLNILLGEVNYRWFELDGLDDSDLIVFVKLYDEDEKVVFSLLKKLFLLDTDFIKVDLQGGANKYFSDYLEAHPEEKQQGPQDEEMKEADEAEDNKEDKDKDKDKEGTTNVDVEEKKKEDPAILELKQFIKSLKTKKLTKDSKPLDDLDYVIDENELKGIPQENIPQLTKDIKEFRLNVIKIEKQKKAKEKREAIKRNKEQLKLLFKKFSNGEVKDEDDDDEDEEDDDEGLTDEQFEARKKKLKAEEITKAYNAALLKVKAQEKQNLELVKQLKLVQNYEQDLVKHKDRDSEYRSGQFKYFRSPSFSREAEIKKDKADKEQELKELESLQKSNDFLSSLNILPQQPSTTEDQEMKDVTEEDVETMITNTTLQITESKLTPLLESLKPQFNKYVLKYLDVEDDELVEFIIGIIAEFKDKAKLVEELTETFDENGSEMGDLIWNDLKSSVRELKENE